MVVGTLYCGYGYDEYFGKVEELFEERFADAESGDCQYEHEYKTWHKVMENFPDDESEGVYKCGKRLTSLMAYKKWFDDMEDM